MRKLALDKFAAKIDELLHRGQIGLADYLRGHGADPSKILDLPQDQDAMVRALREISHSPAGGYAPSNVAKMRRRKDAVRANAAALLESAHGAPREKKLEVAKQLGFEGLVTGPGPTSKQIGALAGPHVHSWDPDSGRAMIPQLNVTPESMQVIERMLGPELKATSGASFAAHRYPFYRHEHGEAQELLSHRKKMKENEDFLRGAQEGARAHGLPEPELASEDLPHQYGAVPFASHLGVRPTVEEYLASWNDPTLHMQQRALRRGTPTMPAHPDDAYFDRAYRAVGGTANRRIQPGTKQEAALRELMAAHVRGKPSLADLNARYTPTGDPFADIARKLMQSQDPAVLAAERFDKYYPGRAPKDVFSSVKTKPLGDTMPPVGKPKRTRK